MDRFTIRNLELISTGTGDGHTLHKVLDNTVSPMGARMLKRWIVLPLKDMGKINERLNLVENIFIKETDLRNNLTHKIKQCGDIEKISQ
jgi:DNA mismatch repair protein MutS